VLQLWSKLILQKLRCIRGFLISHLGDDDELVNTAWEAKQIHQKFQIGINLLSKPAHEAAHQAQINCLDMVWADYMGVDSNGLTPCGKMLSMFAQGYPNIKLFASVAFKYQYNDPNPEKAARMHC